MFPLPTLCQVDLLPEAGPAKTFGLYTAGIEICHQFVTYVATETVHHELAFQMLVISDLLDMKEVCIQS